LELEKVRLETSLELLTRQLEEKNAELVQLRDALTRAQDALVAKESPEAYRDRRNAEYDAQDIPMTPEQRAAGRRRRKLAEMNGRLLNEMEEPMFKDAEDMIDILTRHQSPPEHGSLHGNDES
jgi:hypothetical protein